MALQRVSPAEAHSLVSEQGYVFLDVRSVPEFEQGHPNGAYNIPLLHLASGGMQPNEGFDLGFDHFDDSGGGLAGILPRALDWVGSKGADSLLVFLHAYDVRTPSVEPPELWQVPLGACIESTPAVWKGRVYVGTRGGFVYALGD